MPPTPGPTPGPTSGPAPGPHVPELSPWVCQALRCPATGEPLVSDPDGGPRLVAVAAGLAYPVHEGVPHQLVDQAESVSGALSESLSESMSGAQVATEGAPEG